MEDIHGNSKRESAAYKRTHPDVIANASQELLVKKPRQVYKEMVLKDEANAPKNMQQLRALNHRNDQKNNSYSGNNVADEVLEVLKMLNENDFVQKVEHTKGQVRPSFYTMKNRWQTLKNVSLIVTNHELD